MEIPIHLTNNVHNFLREIQLVDTGFKKVRVGHPHDGGYIVLDEIAKNIEVVYSFGVANDATFDQQFSERYGSFIKLFDHTVDGIPYNGERGATKVFPSEFHKKGVGCLATNEVDTLENLSKGDFGKNLLLKMDVEGAEWLSLAISSRSILRNFSMILIELHHLQKLFPESCKDDQNRYDIKSFSEQETTIAVDVIKKLADEFYIFHAHVNNGFPIQCWKEYSVPPILELSFVRKDLIKNPKLVNWKYEDVDAPNNHFLPEIHLDFWPFVR